MEASTENKESKYIVDQEHVLLETQVFEFNKATSQAEHSFAGCLQKFRKNIRIIAFLALLVLISVILAFIKTSPAAVQISNKTIDSVATSTPVTTAKVEDVPFEIVSRSEWQAEEPKRNIPNLATPVSRVIVTHTAGDGCSTRESCIERIQALQQDDTVRNDLADIAPNFLIGGDGAVYEGRGWTKQGNSKHASENHVSITIAFIGERNRTAPTGKQLGSFDNLVKFGKETLTLFAESQLTSTDDPWTMFYKKLSNWDVDPN